MSGFRRYQRGASIWTVLLMVVVIGFAALFGLKLIPVYIESFKIDKAMEGVLEGDVASMSKRDIATAVVRRLDIDGVQRIQERNFFEYATIEKKGPRVTLRISYEDEKPLFGNLSVVARFDKIATN